MPGKGKPFEKGKAPKSPGRPRIPEEFKERAKASSLERCLPAWEQEIDERGPNWLKASELLAAYGQGKPSQPVEHSGKDGGPLELTVRFVKAGEK